MGNKIMKFLAAAVLAVAVSSPALAAIAYNTGPVDPSNIRGVINLLINQINSAISMPTGPFFANGITFSNQFYANPLVQDTSVDIPVASVNVFESGVVIQGVSGRTIYPTAVTVMASGTPSASTSLKVVCEPSGQLLGTFLVANLVTNTPVNAFSSVGATPGQALNRGCAAGDGVYASNVGTNMATTTDIFVNLPYTVQ